MKRAKRFEKTEKPKQEREVKIQAKTPAQKDYLRSLNDMSKDTVGMGYAGTGKTYMAVMTALQKYIKGDVEKIVLVRPAVSCSKSIGLLPGSLDEKMAPWIKPFTDILQPVLGKGRLELDMKNGLIEILPLEYIQGLSFKYSYVIVDEAENCTDKEIYLLLTRRGEKSKIVLAGDTRQSAINLNQCGLHNIVTKNRRVRELLDIIDFGTEDVVRSELCRKYIEAYGG